MAVINPERFTRLPESGATRRERYFDQWTGQPVSRRFATQATTNMKIEERQALIRIERQQALIARGEKPDIVMAKTGLPLLESYIKDLGHRVRGEGASEFKEVKETLREIKRENPDDWRSKQISYLYDRYGKDAFDEFDWHAYFGSPGRDG